jgi:dTDP-4-dehydrorhamnose 3,5-epimerase
MNVTATSLPGVLVIEPRVFHDGRGLFLELFNAERFIELGLPTSFCQDNRSRSARGVLRGLHYQLTHPQGKLVTVAHGRIFDVAVDVRVGSPTFGQWTGVTLDADEPRLMWIPPGFAHGFCALSESADVIYKCTELYYPADEGGVLWCDERIGVEWPVREPLVSNRDRALPRLDPSRTDLPRYQP